MCGLSSGKDPHLVTTQWKKQLTNVFLLIIILVFSGVISFMMPIDNNSNVPQYLGSAVLQSFAALIAIPFAFYASYLYSKYGMTGLQFAIDRVKTYILPLFSLVALFSIVLMTRDVSDEHLIGWSRILIFALIISSSILL